MPPCSDPDETPAQSIGTHTSPDVDFVDTYAREPVESRSAVIQDAIGLLREAQLEEDHAAAWQEWETTEDARLWERTVGDGVS